MHARSHRARGRWGLYETVDILGNGRRWTIMADVSEICLGDGRKMPMLGFGTYLGGQKDVSCALKCGYRLIDTASLYDNEEEVGVAIQQSGIPRHEIFVVTKLWNTDHGRANTIRSFNESLKRLGLQYVDLYLMHSPSGGRTLETWDAMVELKQEGKIRSIGVANFNVHHLKELKKARPDHIPAVNQIEIHPFLSWDELVVYCKQESIPIMAYSPLAKAMKMRDPKLISVGKKPQKLDVESISAESEAEYGKSAAQVMIRWSIQQGFVCIPKSSNEVRIVENFNVFDFEIAEEDMQTLNSLDEHLISDWPGIMNCQWDP